MAVSGLGLLSGIGEGFKQGLQSYQDETRYQDKQKLAQQDEARKQLASNIQLKMAGLQQGDDGSLGYTDDQQKQQDLKNIQTSHSLDKYDPDSDISKSARQTTQGLLKGAGVNAPIPSTFSAADIEDQAKEGLLGKSVAGAYSAQGRQITSQRVADRNDILRDNADMRRDQMGTNAGQAFEKDPIIKQTKTTTNSLNRAESLLNGNEPITAKSFAVLQQDFINAMAPGGAATEGKVNREMVNTAAGALNDLQLKFGQVKDLRQEQPQVVENLKHLISQVKGDYGNAQSEQARNIHDSFVNSSNPVTQKTIQSKLKTYAPDQYQQLYGGGGDSPQSLPSQAGPVGLIGAGKAGATAPTPAPSGGGQSFTPDVVSYAQSHGITPAQALSIKQQRGGQ